MSRTEEVAKFQFGLFKTKEKSMFYFHDSQFNLDRIKFIMYSLPKDGSLPIYFMKKV